MRVSEVKEAGAPHSLSGSSGVKYAGRPSNESNTPEPRRNLHAEGSLIEMLVGFGAFKNSLNVIWGVEGPQMGVTGIRKRCDHFETIN